MSVDFNAREPDEQATQLALHFPKGKLWGNVFDGETNMGKLIRGLAVEFYRIELLLENFVTELDINETEQLIIEWEASVGIPDVCFGRSQDLQTRREQVIQKLSDFGGVQTEADFRRVAALFGYDVTLIESGIVPGSFPARFPNRFLGGVGSSSHTIIVSVNSPDSNSFPRPFPDFFIGTSLDVLKCLFRALAPANCDLIYTTTG